MARRGPLPILLVLVAALVAAMTVAGPAAAVEVGDPKTALVHKLFTLFKKGGDDVASDAAVAAVKGARRYGDDAGKALVKLQDDAAKVTDVLDDSVRRVLKETDESLAGGVAYARAAKTVEAGGEMPVDAALSMFEAADVLMRAQPAARKLAVEAGGEASLKLPQELETLYSAMRAHLAKMKGPNGKYRLFTHRNGNLMSVADNHRANELLLKVRRGGELNAEELATLHSAKLTESPSTFEKALAQAHNRHGKGLKSDGGNVLQASTDVGKLAREAARADQAARKLLKQFGRGATFDSVSSLAASAAKATSKDQMPLAARRMMELLEQHKAAVEKAKKLNPDYFPTENLFTGKMDDALTELRVFFKDPPAVSGDGVKYMSRFDTGEAREIIDALQHGSSSDIIQAFKKRAFVEDRGYYDKTPKCPRCSFVSGLLTYYDGPVEKQMRLAVQRASERGALGRSGKMTYNKREYYFFDGEEMAAKAQVDLKYRNGKPKAIPGVADDAHKLDDDVAARLKDLDSALAGAVKNVRRVKAQLDDVVREIAEETGQKGADMNALLKVFAQTQDAVPMSYNNLYAAVNKYKAAVDEARKLNKGFMPPGVETFSDDATKGMRYFFENPPLKGAGKYLKRAESDKVQEMVDILRTGTKDEVRSFFKTVTKSHHSGGSLQVLRNENGDRLLAYLKYADSEAELAVRRAVEDSLQRGTFPTDGVVQKLSKPIKVSNGKSHVEVIEGQERRVRISDNSPYHTGTMGYKKDPDRRITHYGSNEVSTLRGFDGDEVTDALANPQWRSGKPPKPEPEPFVGVAKDHQLMVVKKPEPKPVVKDPVPEPKPVVKDPVPEPKEQQLLLEHKPKPEAPKDVPEVPKADPKPVVEAPVTAPVTDDAAKAVVRSADTPKLGLKIAAGVAVAAVVISIPLFIIGAGGKVKVEFDHTVELPGLDAELRAVRWHFANGATRIDPDASALHDEPHALSHALKALHDATAAHKEAAALVLTQLDKQQAEYEARHDELDSESALKAMHMLTAARKEVQDSTHASLKAVREELRFSRVYAGGFASTVGTEAANARVSRKRSHALACWASEVLSAAGVRAYAVEFGHFGNAEHCRAQILAAGLPEDTACLGIDAKARKWADAEDASAEERAERLSTLKRLEADARRAELHFDAASAKAHGFTGSCCHAVGGGSCGDGVAACSGAKAWTPATCSGTSWHKEGVAADAFESEVHSAAKLIEQTRELAVSL